MSRSDRYAFSGRIFICLWICFSLFTEAARAKVAGPRISIGQAKWAKGVLTVKGTVRHGTAASVDLYDGSGRLLGQAPVDSRHRFALRRTDLDQPELLCSVQAKATDATATAKVKGKPKACAKVPQCKILSPVGSVAAAVNTDVSFKAKATLKDKMAEPLKMEWDFGGGSMGEAVPGTTPATYRRPAAPETTVQFVRDNARYRVRFTAWDQRNRYCEDSVEVIVGTPPDALEEFAGTRDAVSALAESAQQAAPSPGGAGALASGDTVVLPFEDWSMQNITDARTAPNLHIVYGPQVSTLNALAYRKARQPVALDGDKIDLSYSAASSASDPAGRNSINSTSQNWPVGRSLLLAVVQKSDFFERSVPVGTGSHDHGFSYSYASTPAAYGAEITNLPDEGYHNASLVPALNPEHGRYMPGIGSPYAANAAQPFSGFEPDAGWFAAAMLPVTDIDDSGRVNPFPLFRVQARDPASGAPAAATDMVLTASRDLHCRECHAKGKIGANADAHPADSTRSVAFFPPASDSLFDQEYAAIRNLAGVHSPYGQHMSEHFDNGTGPQRCATCHPSSLSDLPFRQPLRQSNTQENSEYVHQYHGRLQYNASRDDILRNNSGGPVKFDLLQWDPQTGSNPNSLFPVKDASGAILPMEQNCLRCHAGMREQCYRDRMYSAGVTCYQCHGDLLAVGRAYKKTAFNPDGNDFREPWLDQPDCASCHTGNGNRGSTGVDGYYSAGVMNIAFDPADPAATPRRPDPFNPDESRFAVPLTPVDLQHTVEEDFRGPGPHSYPLELQVPLFRLGKDRHGQVACAACHGAAHAVWPNRNPNANDNVTALQLQGHAGPIAECGVCHTADSFARFEDLDEGLKASDPKTGVLGGPHTMHPVNDPNWWQNAGLDTAPNQSSGKIAGGWHNDYAKLPGAAGEDQCAACHGNDHRGTRLSQTPVERRFVDEKGKPVKVKAGTPIGCNLCHSIEKSCTGSPAGSDCGKASDRVAATTNRPPVFQSQPLTAIPIGAAYRYDAEATDPDGDPVRYRISPPVDGMTIDPVTGVIDLAPMTEAQLDAIAGYYRHDMPADNGHYPPYMLAVRVIATDSRGAYAVQAIRIGIDCPAGQVRSTNRCGPIHISSVPDLYGLNEGEAYDYRVAADIRSGLAVTYSLSDAPDGMTIDAATGAIHWTALTGPFGMWNFRAVATDSAGHSATQTLDLTVCPKPEKWMGSGCLQPIVITSAPAPGVNAGDDYDAAIVARHRNGLTLSYSLSDAPPGMTVDGTTGAVHWHAQAEASGSIYPSIVVTDSQGYALKQTIALTVCVAPERWREDLAQCHGPIDFTSESPVYGAVAGDSYAYRVTATHRDGLPISFGLVGAPAGMTIDPATGLINWLVQSNPDGYVGFSITAGDASGAVQTQEVSLNICESGMRWDPDVGCQGPVVIEPQTVFGVDAGATYTYAVKASLPGGGPITYNLADAPNAMTIDEATGIVSWKSYTDPQSGNSFFFTIIASDDQGRQTLQYGYLTVCESPQHWNNDAQSCL